MSMPRPPFLGPKPGPSERDLERARWIHAEPRSSRTAIVVWSLMAMVAIFVLILAVVAH